MSMFLPEGGQQAQPGVAAVTPANPETTADDIALMQRAFAAAARNPNLIPSDFMAYLVDFIQTARLTFPVGQIFGFLGFVPQVATAVSTLETTTSDTFVDLTTPGPLLEGLGAGSYLVLYRADTFSDTAAKGCAISPSFNGVTPTTNDSAFNVSTNELSTVGFTTATLVAAANTIELKYRRVNGGGTASFERRQLTAIKYANH